VYTSISLQGAPDPRSGTAEEACNENTNSDTVIHSNFHISEYAQSADIVASAFLRSFCEKGTEDLAHLRAFALRATCMLGAMLGNPFGALEFSTALAASVFVYWHESSPAETTTTR
jgi:hypothetical protein